MQQLTLMVCPHDTVHNPDRWYSLIQYLARRCPDHQLHFELCLDFVEFQERLGEADIVYANPGDALRLIGERGFVPLARPAGIYDEAVIVAEASLSGVTLESLAGAKVVTVRKLMPAQIGLRALSRRNVVPGELLDRDSWLAVVSAVVQGDAPYGIVYRDTFEHLSASSKELVQVIAESQEQLAFHCLVARADIGDCLQTLRQSLVQMAETSEGQQLLAELGFSAWLPVDGADLAMMQTLKG